MNRGVKRRLCLLSLLLIWPLAEAKRSRIIINAKASESFQEFDSARDKNVPINYFMLKGKFFPGDMRDKGLDTYEFKDLALSVMEALGKQNYQPTLDSKESDLIVSVNWGLTSVELDEYEVWGVNSEEEMMELMGVEDANDLPSDWERNSEARMSRVLGFSEALDSTATNPTDQRELATSLKSERYFIVVIAFNAESFLQKEENPKIEWITRYSLDSSRIDFGEAVLALNHAASDYLGKSSDSLIKTSVDNGDIKMGELEVVEEEE